MSAASGKESKASSHACGVCKAPATLQCPTCRELVAPDGWFCSKKCFEGCWDTHKEYHKKVKAALAELFATAMAEKSRTRLPKGFEGYSFTGKLRPGEVTSQVTVPAGILKPDYADTGIPKSENALRGSNVIPVHTPDQIKAAREASRIGREVLDIAAAALKPGVTGDEIDKIVHAACMERGVYPSPLNYMGFPKSLCISSNEVICHGIPDTRPIQDGEIVNLDVSVYTKEGFHADLNETYLVGNVNAAGKKLVKCAYECLAAAISVCKPGVMYRDVGTVISRVAADHGFSVVKSFCGHGVGQLFHCAPNVPHYAKNKAVGMMKAGHIFTIEPMINEGTGADDMWPDGWTAVTRDGKRSAQFEHTLLVTETGVEVLSARVGAPTTTGIVWDEAAIQRPGADAAAAAAAPAAAADGAKAAAAADASAPVTGGAGVTASEASAAGGAAAAAEAPTAAAGGSGSA